MKRFLSSLWFLSILFIFISCEIGLGASVDTEAPNLEIQNPSPDAIIRGVFKIGGTWSDDGTIETVSVKLSRTDGKGKELEYQATFAVSNEDSPNTWNCIINPQDPANIVLDGNYVAQVDITDTGKHTTTKTVQFAIDNTAPVIVLQRPSTKIDALQVDSYGQKFTLEGQAADDNNVSLIEVQIYADKECTTLLHTVPLSNVPNSINLDVAEFKENVETDYSKIYGSTQKSGQKNFYCKVVAYDGAVYYPYDRTQTPEDLKGNKTSIYYLYEDIATAVLGEVKITDVYHILSGVYGLEKESSRSAETNSLIAKVKSTLEKNVVNTGSFSLNPANNPTFSVSGKEPLQKDENGNVNFASGNYDITNGSQVIMEVTPGLDNIPLDGNSLKVYCIECDAKGTAKSGASKIYPATEMKKSGTTYKYTVSVKKQDGLVIGRNYLFGVDGYDEKKNNVVCSDNLGYGFHFSTSGAAPGLTILEPEAGSVTLANGKKLKISGTTTVEAGTPVITITDNKVNKTTLTFQESEATEDENKQLIYTFSTEIDFTGGSAYHELEIVSDLEGIKTTRTKSVSYDSEKPVIAINSVNPIVEKTESNGQLKKCLNGEVQISFSLTDDFSFIDTTTNKPYFELCQNNEKKYTATFTSTNSAVTETVTVDTNKLIDNTPLEIKVFTWDRAGNKAEYSDKQYQIDQSTDKPQITPKNNINFNLKSEEDIKEAGNNENRISMGGTVSFTVTDDDGIDYIAVYSQTKDAQGKITETLYNRYPKEGSSKETQTPYSFILPSKSGYYLYRLEVKDIINTKAENNKQEYQFMIKATSPAPTIELISEEDSSTNFDNNADGYIKAGGAFVNTITVESVESPFTLWEKIDDGEYKKVENIKLENSEGKNYFKRKVSPIVTSTYYYKVEDSNEQYSSERSVKCKVDNDASTITPKSYPQTKQDTRVSQYTISGTAADTDSGVNKVYIAFANEDKKYSDWKEVGGTENWYYTLKYAEDDNFKEYFSQEKHGIKYIKFKVVDKVGWEYETQAIQFFYDTADPTAEITAYKTEAADYTVLTSAGVKTGKAFSLKGKATDDWEIETATLTQTFKPKQNESGEQQTEKSLTLTLELGSGGSWEEGNLPRSYEQGKDNEAALITGDYVYKLVVKDKAGNETQTILNVEVDTTAPQITVNDLKGQNNNEFINTKNFSITGTIEESNLSTAEAKLMKKDGSNNPVATGQISPDNDGSFSWKVYEVADGEYTVEVYAIDSFGNNTTEKGSSFTVDTIAPVSTLTATGNQVYDNTGKAVTELTSGSTYYVKGNYTLSGTVTETNFKSAKLGEETLTASSGPWSKEITPSDETTKTQKITLEDKAGNKTVYTVYVAKDTSAPLLTVTSPAEGSNAASITVTGQVSDLGIGVESVSYELYKDGVETPVTTQTLTNKAGQFNFTPAVDLTGKGEGKYKIKVTAQDKLENKTTATVVNFMYDNTPPTLSDPKITPPPIRNDYNVGSGETYTVYAKDTFDIEVNATDLVSGVNTVTAESGNTKVTLTKDEQGNGTGKYKGSITAQLDDKNTTTITITATDFCNQTSTVSITNVMVDKVAPNLTVTSAVPQITNKSFTVSGTVSDEIKIGDIPVIVKESAEKTYAVNITDGTGENAGKKVWSFTVNPSQSGGNNSAADGNHTFTIEATDKAGNKASESIEVITDVTKPTVSISKTPDVNATEGTVFVFEGTADDGSGSGVSEIWMKFGENGTVFKASGTSSWLKSITFSEYSNVFNTSGEKEVYVMAKDRAGNESNWKSQDFIYDTKKPDAKISEYKIGDATDYTPLTSAGVKTGKAFSLKGIATDDWSVTSVKLTQIFKPKQNESGAQQTENSLTLTLELGTDGSWEVGNLPRSYEQGKENEAALITGDYEYKLVVTDSAEKTTETIINAEVDTTAPVITVNDLKGQNNDEFINTKNLTITGKIIESNFKTATAKLVKKGETSPVKNETLSPDQDGDFSWKVYEVEDGEYTVEVYAKDDFGNENTGTGSSFTVDTTAPVSTLTATGNQVYDNTGTAVTELTSGSTYYVKGDYRLSGTVTETNFKSVKLGEEEFDLNADGITWDKEITPSDETTKTQTITLEDKAGNKTVYTVYVSKDTSAPLLTVTSPTEGENVTLEKDSNTALITVTGQVSDLGIGVDSVSYELYKDGMETPVTTQTLTNIAGQFAFTSVDLTGEGEGKYTIKVTAQDKLGNKKTEVINFMYDKSAPELSDAKITTDYIRNDYTVGSGENQITYTVYDKDTFDIEVNATDLVSGVNTVTAESGNTKVTLTEEKDEQGNGTGKYKGTITAVLNKDNITTITIKATDFCNQTSTVSITNVMVDKVAPTISNLNYPTIPQKDKFTISVNASDLIALAEVNPVKIKYKYKKNESDETLTELPMTLNNDVYEIELTPGTGTDSDSVHYISDGNHTFTIEATDKAGNKASQSIEVVTDVTAPTWVTTPKISSKTAYEQTITENGNSETRKYYKSNLININVKATDDTSGVKEIVYNLDSAKNESTGNANITLDNLSEGKHTVSIKAVDEAGNVSNDTILIFYIDTQSPLKPELMSIDSESGAALEGYKDESKSKLVNGKSDVTFVLSVSDASSKAQESDTEYMSGIKSVEVLRIASNNVNITGQKVENENGKYTITIPANKLATGSVTVRITDNVGNTYEGTVFNLQLDNTPPVLKISSPAVDATVNKTITISGATTDNNAVAQTVLTVEKGNDVVGGKTFTAENSNELSWSLDLDTFVENITNTEKTENLTISVTATDKAGNTVSETRTITVDQDTDRPEISFNNVTLGNAMSSSDSNYIWLKNTTKLYGTVEDDDGINSMKISNNGTNWHDVTLNTANTSWSFDVKNFFGDETANKEDAANGAHTIYFKVTDKEGEEFTSATSSSLYSVYLVDGKIKYGTIGAGSEKPDSVLYVKVDTLFPEVILIGARIGTTGDFSNAYSNMMLGGAQRTMQFKLTAKDSNGIESVSGTAEFEFDGASVTLSSPEVKAYKAGDEETKVGASDAEYYIVSFTVDLVGAQSGLNGKDGRISLKFTGKDKAGNSSAQTATINYDYKKPEVTITSPKDSNWVSGIVTAYGTIDSAATMYYALSPSDKIIPAEPDAVSSGGNITGQTAESETSDPHEVTSWSGIDPDGLAEVNGSGITVTPKYSQIKGNGVQWFVYFDNQPSTELATHDVEFKKYLINSGITTDEAIGNKSFKTIVRLYLWVKSIDLAGNITVEKFPILVDPQGDAPQVTISYPAKDGEKLGGAVTLLGTASDTIGTEIGIKNVWVQIMSGTNNLAATPTIADVNLWIGKGYKVYTNINENSPTEVNSAIDSSSENYYIQANVSGSSWSLKINEKDEFNPKKEGITNTIVYRVYAQDNDNNLSKYQTQYSIFDADSPVLSDLYLRQYSNPDGTGTITASRPYEDDMWIKGDWWLYGTVKDTQGIGSLTVDGKTDGISVSGEANAVEVFNYKISTTGRDAGNMKIKIEAIDNATGESHKTTKECSINYDNKVPVSNVPVIANNKIQNANGFFTFSAEVKEDAVGGAAQSGFKYLAFYFTRGNKVYDIMRSKTDENSAIDKSNSAISTEDGLIWKNLTVTRSSENLAIITLSNEDANIHTGRLCKIGGSIYMIKNANGTTIELDGSPEMPASGNSQEALFAIANVVNNNIESGKGTKSTSEDSYGYGYFTSISNDDGDHMVESVLKTGTTWKWEANINSRNIPDGEVTLHYVAFDAAGNYSAKEISGLQIANNAPRLASVKVWTDYNGNGIEDDNEHATKYYSKKTVVIGGKSQTKSQDLTSDLLLSGNDKDEANDGSAFMTIKAETKLILEIVGGNGDLYYTYKTKNKKDEPWSDITKSNDSFATGNDDGIDDEAGNGGYYVVDDENTAYISGTIYDGKTPGKNPIVITTGILGGLKNNENNSDPTWFEYVIYDSTEGCTEWSDSNYTSGRLSAKFKVALNVQYNDEVKPQVAVRPFYWNSKTDNSVCWDSTTGSALGHIELEDDLSQNIKDYKVNNTALGEDPKVSGKIKIEGYAFDNIKLKELYVQFDGHKDISSETLAATYTTSGSWEKSSTETATENDKTWDFEVTDVFNNSEGHLVYWTLTVDTQAVSGQTQVARLDQKVTVIAKDERGKEGTTTGGLKSASSGTPGKQEMLWKDVKTFAGAATMFYTDSSCNTLVNADTSDNTTVYLEEKWDYQMDIVPYITGVNTSLSTLDRRTPSKFDRTALGHYPVRIVTKAQNGSTNQAETVTFTGFNLGSNTSLTVSSLTTENDSTTGGRSAKYSLSVNNIPTLNNMNDNNAKGSYSGIISDNSSYNDKVQYAYNRQPNNANNNKLTDDIIFDVWQFNSAAAVPISGKIEQPVMKIRPTDGKIGFAFVNGPLYFSMGGSVGSQNYSYQYWMASYDFFTSVGFTYDDDGNSWGVAAGGDINSDHADKFQLMSSKWGLSNRTKDGSYTKENSMRLESIGMKGTKVDQTSTTENFDKQRIRSPSLASTVHNGYTNLYLAYYDAMNDELRFKAGRERERGDSYVLQIKRTDNPGSNYAGAWVVPPNNNKDIFANGDFIYLCDKDGNLSEDKYYTLGGYYTGGFDGSGQVAFVAYDSYGNKIAPFPGTGGKNYTKDGDFHNLTDDVYIKVIKNPKSFVNGSSFYDFDTEKKPYAYRNSAVNIVAGDGVTGYGAGEYVSLGVVPGSNINDDVVVITWYDTNARTLYYSYNATPLTDRRGTYNAANGTTGWSAPVAVFAEKDYDYAGEYCKIAVDKNGGIHIAAYDPVNLDLVYAYASSYNSNFTTCVVDSNGVVGSNLTLDVALENGKAVPFIGYYATSCIKPKYARLVGNLSNGSFDGSINDEVTGKWEISVVPTSSIIEMQSNQHNDINIGVWKDSSGKITNPTTTGTSEISNTSSGYSSTSYGQIYGNGTKNPVLGYAIKYGSSSDTIETAQMK